MFCKIKIKYFVLILILFNANMAYAEENFGVTLDCYEGCNDGQIDYNKNLMLELTIKNNYDYWVYIGEERGLGTEFLIEMKNINLETESEIEYLNDYLDREIFIKPKSEIKIYIPFNGYNKLENDNRLGDWEIKPELRIKKFKLYANPFDSTEVFLSQINTPPIDLEIVGNFLKFTTVKPEVEVTGKISIKILDGLFENPVVIYIISPLIVGLVLYFLNKRYR